MNQSLTCTNAIHRLLHTLWTKAVGTKDYDKAEWRELEAEITNLRNRAVDHKRNWEWFSPQTF